MDLHVEKLPSNRSFGLVMVALFVLIGVGGWLLHGAPMRPWAVSMAVGFGAVTALAPDVLTPLNRLWMKLGLLLGHIVGPVVMGILFWVGVVPVGLLMRAFGKDPLQKARKPKGQTYWISRRDTQPGPLENQF